MQRHLVSCGLLHIEYTVVVVVVVTATAIDVVDFVHVVHVVGLAVLHGGCVCGRLLRAIGGYVL